MKKIETIWHYLLWSAVEKKQYRHTQAGLAADFGYSLSTVNLALARPTAIGAIRKSGKFFVLADYKKLLYFWATARTLSRDILYHTRAPQSVRELAGIAPPGAVFAGYSAASKLLGEPPADYTKLYLYVSPDRLQQAALRYPKATYGPSEIIILRLPQALGTFGSVTTLPWTFVDIWNMSDWYAHDFAAALEEKIYGLLS